MGIGRMARACGGVLAALWLASPVYASTLTIVVDTTLLAQSLAGQTVDLAFDLTASTENTVTITTFSSDGTLGGSSVSPPVSGTFLDLPVILGGDPNALFPVEYLQTITLGDSLAFTFYTTTLPVDSTSFADSFAFFILVDGVPVIDDPQDPTGALVTYDFGIEIPVLTLYSSDTLPIREGIVSNNVVEPGALALVIAALLALAAMLPVARIQSRK